MKNTTKLLKENAMFLTLTFAFLFLLPNGLFAGTPFDGVVTKTTDVKTTILNVAKVLAVIGIIIGGIKKVLGHPDSWNWLWKSSLGAFIIFSADAIVKWLAT